VDQFEAVVLVFLFTHALAWFNLMRLLAMELLAVGAHILLWLIALFSASAGRLGMLDFLAIMCTWLAFFFGPVAVRTPAICRFGVGGAGVLSHHCLEVGYQFGNQMRGSCAWCCTFCLDKSVPTTICLLSYHGLNDFYVGITQH
jgi:hypothetical protein